jgi:predicted lactoylglutathione lyase
MEMDQYIIPLNETIVFEIYPLKKIHRQLLGQLKDHEEALRDLYSSSVMIGFSVQHADEINNVCDMIVQYGGRVESHPQPSEFGTRAVAYDRDGYRLEITCKPI